MTLFPATPRRPTVLHGDALNLPLPDASITAVVTDPPYGLEFMGHDWDAPWTETGINRDAGFSHVAHRDGYSRLPMPSFTGSTNPRCVNCGGTRRGRRDGTAIRAVCVCPNPVFPNVRAVEMRAFQQWTESWAREALRVLKPGGYLAAFGGTRTWHRLASALEDSGFEIRDSIAWLFGQGFPKTHASLKPGFEPIVLARKPLAGSEQANLLLHGTGVLNIDACRIPMTDADRESINAKHAGMDPASYVRPPGTALNLSVQQMPLVAAHAHDEGRWPANVVLDEAMAEALDEQSGVLSSGANPTRRSAPKFGDVYGDFAGQPDCVPARGADVGGASRFFTVFRYQAKAPASERPVVDGVSHPTVKPLGLMRWLCRLLVSGGGVLLDQFAGSGTTLEAAVLEGILSIGVERDARYLPLIEHRIARAAAGHAAVPLRAVRSRLQLGQATLFDFPAEGGDIA